MMLTGEKLKFLLSSHRKTSRELAEFISISGVQISRWINGVKPIPKIHYRKIAKFFDISLEQLTNGIPTKNKIIYDIIDTLSKDEKLDLIVYITNTLGGVK